MREEDKPEFVAMSESLHHQYEPRTEMQTIGFDNIVCCSWRVKLSLRQETFARALQFTHSEDENPKNESSGEKVLTQWVGASDRDLRDGIRFLRDLQADVAECGLLHLESDGPLKDSVIKAFGASFFNSMVEWKGMSPSALQMASHLATHNETFPNIPPSPPLRPGVPRVVADPKLKWEMVVKIIDLKIQSLNELALQEPFSK